MKLIRYPERSQWRETLKRPSLDFSALETSVTGIISEVRRDGDAAVQKFSQLFDKVVPDRLLVSPEEIADGIKQVSGELKAAIQLAKRNIETFHASQKGVVESVETMPGVKCWRKSVAIEKVGLYIPGGTAPLFSTLLMLSVPAKLAGCREIILCSPPGRDNRLHPAMLYAADIVGVTRIFKVGGVQAIAAMAFGTQTIPAVNKIFGPGNQYVTLAKQLIQKEGVAIDMPAGPSEVAVFADDTAEASFVAADLLSQAEHGVDSQVILVSVSPAVLEKVTLEVNRQLMQLPRKEYASKALENSRMILVKNDGEAIDLLNEYAAEHLILCCANALEMSESVINAGSVFIGNYSPESAGDYASGTNHTLPTNGYAKAYSGVSLDSFVKKITFQQLSQEGLRNIGPAIEHMAEAEGLQAHKNAVSIRLKYLQEKDLS
jgi:histidinol dehydrogenase